MTCQYVMQEDVGVLPRKIFEFRLTAEQKVIANYELQHDQKQVEVLSLVSGYDIIYLWYETEYCFPLVIKQEVSPKLEDILDTCWKVLPTRGVVSHAIITDTFLLDLHEYTSV